MNLKFLVPFNLGLVAALLSTAANASPILQQYHLDQLEQQQFVSAGSATILDILKGRPEFSKLFELIKKDDDLTKRFGNPDAKLTFFAPTNDAFESVPDNEHPSHDELLYHVCDEDYESFVLRNKFVIKSLFESPGLNNAPQLLRVSLESPEAPPHLQAELQAAARPRETSLYINHAKVIIPDLVAQSGGIVHGVNRIIRLPEKTVLDEIEKRPLHFSILKKVWASTGVEDRIRDSKDITLFASTDSVWKALPPKFAEWLFSNEGREHLKIVAFYQIANRAVYTPEMLNKTREDGTPEKNYHDIILQTLLNSPGFKLNVRAHDRKETRLANYHETSHGPSSLADLIEAIEGLTESSEGDGLWDGSTSTDPNHSYSHPHRDNYQTQSHNGGGGNGGHRRPRRDEIVINEKARIIQGYENLVTGNGVIHLVDKVVMPARGKGCHGMTAADCVAWEFMWDRISDESGELAW